jgi:hypothetical protein
MTAYVILQDHPLPAGGVASGYHGRAVGCSRLPVAARDGDTIVAIAGEAMAERHALEALLPPSTA